VGVEQKGFIDVDKNRFVEGITIIKKTSAKIN
jgi:hypothetical protein